MTKGYWTGLNEIKEDFTKLASTDVENIKRELITLIGTTCLKLLQEASPKATGEYSRGWKIINQTATAIEIGNDNDGLVDILEKGTGPRRIYPKVGPQNGVLVFDIGGKTVFSRYVNHPGTSPQPHIEKVREVMDSLILDFVQAIMSKYSKFFNISAMPKTSNIQKIGGLSGFNANMGRGRIHMIRPRTGFKVFKRRIGLRRRTGHSIRSDIKIG